jgi:7,8-dihydropterin-6-yl-methyl-4-(beta-D-ribofuranosyl)aminobenzene 5'-phosphate synthase
LKNSKKELSGLFNLITTTEPYRISEKIYFLGEIPRLTHFESKNTTFVLENGDPDFVMDDSAVVMILPEGLFVVTGCGHAGVVNTLEHAKRVTGLKNIHGIMGGFHLRDIDLQTRETINYLQESKIKHILPSHCTDDPALDLFHETFKSRQVRTGDVLKF